MSSEKQPPGIAMPVDVVIMAAGKGTRMLSSLPKVLHLLGGRPLLQHVLDTAASLRARKAVVITGHGAEQVEAACQLDANAELALAFARQQPQLGTGHAVQQALPQLNDDGLVVVLPPASILAENPVAWVDHNVQRHHTEAVSRAYLEYLYSDAGQELAAQHFFRPKNQTILARYSTRYKPVELFTVNEIAGGWQKAQQAHFADGGIFDQIYQH